LVAWLAGMIDQGTRRVQTPRRRAVAQVGSTLLAI